MSVTGAAVDLANALKAARLAWEEAQAQWDDAVRRDFEADRWVPLENHVRAVIDALDRLAPVLARAEHDCE